MPSLFLSLLLLMQGIPIQAQQGGTVTGILRDSAGKPALGVRVTAVAVPESPTDAQSSTAMGAIAETDANGQYRLETYRPVATTEIQSFGFETLKREVVVGESSVDLKIDALPSAP